MIFRTELHFICYCLVQLKHNCLVMSETFLCFRKLKLSVENELSFSDSQAFGFYYLMEFFTGLRGRLYSLFLNTGMCLSFPLHTEDHICLWSKQQLLAHIIWAFESIICWEQALNFKRVVKLHIDSGDLSDAYHLVLLREGDKYERWYHLLVNE